MIDLAAIPDQDLKETLELAHPNVLENCDLVTPETLGSKHLLHASTLKQNELTPYISVRANEVEDNTIPRVYVGKTLLNCLEGYASFLKIQLVIEVMLLPVTKADIIFISFLLSML